MELADLKRLLGPEQPTYRALQLYDALYNKRVADLTDVSTLPKSLKNQLLAKQALGLPSLERRFDSHDGTRRYLLRLEDNRTVEAVLMPDYETAPLSKAKTQIKRRDTICISSQVGCPVDCKFCLTALMGLERNLSAGEIVGQVLYIAQENNLRPSDSRMNIVLMGMGEPLLNLDNVLKATRLLTDPKGIGLSPKRITLSTSGIIPQIEALGRVDIRPKLAISLNASTEEQRRELMPITRKYHLKDLLDVCRSFPLRPWEKLTFEYVLLKDVNDTDADARRVVRLLAHLDCKVNLIALNPGPGIPFETPTPDRVQSFQRILRASFPCFVRKPRGRDIFAACGQLKREMPELVDIT
jgi:23S rRNA (adenine2503-C2)-methyltransferase